MAWRPKLKQFLEENEIGIMELTLYLDSQGYVTVTKEEYDNLECVDPDKPCP